MSKKGRPKDNPLFIIDSDRKIKIKCNGCGHIHQVSRTWEISELVSYLECNFCTDCEKQFKGEKFVEKFVIQHNSIHGFRHRFGLLTINEKTGKEKRLYDDTKKERDKVSPAFTKNAWKGYYRSIIDEYSNRIYKYVDECDCGNRFRGGAPPYYLVARDVCANCGGAIPTRKEKEEYKQLRDKNEPRKD